MVTERHAVAYYRVSTKKQGKSGLGLKAQSDAVRLYKRIHKINLAKEFVEIESGKKNKRPVLKDALEYCKKENTLLLIAKLDRLGRNVAFISSLMESKVDFVAVDNPEASPLLLHILAAIAEHERQAISTRTKEALQVAKKKGKILGKNGYILSKKNREDSLRFAKKMNPIIEKLERQGFKTIRQITEELNRRKIPTFRKKDHKWHVATVYKIIKVLISNNNSNHLKI